MAPSSVTLRADPDQTDADLVAAARRGGDEGNRAFGELVRRHQRMVYALAGSLVRPSDVDDVAQEAFLRAFRNLDLLADPAKFGVWLRRIAFGAAIDHARADRSRTQYLIDPRDDEAADVQADSNGTSATDPSPHERLERAELVGRVLSALDRLPARYRVPLTLYHIDGLSHAKVARTLGVPEATVRSLVARARRKLTRLLAHAPEVHDMAEESRVVRENVARVSTAETDVLNDGVPEAPRLLHVLNGDSVRMTLEHSSVPGALATYADVLHEGRVLRATGTPEARAQRARFIADSGYVTYADALRTYEQWDGQLAAFRDYDEVVLWFEHDLFDQLLLVRHLFWFAGRDLGSTTLSLICIGEFPGFESFHGLGELDADQLASLLGTRQRVTPEQIALGARTWEAFTSDDPSALAAVAARATPELPFLAGALERFLEDYPSTTSGLPRTERHVLELLSAGALSPHDLFLAEQRSEERVYMGDSTFWARVRAMSEGATPLVTLDVAATAGLDLPKGSVRITDAGRDVLAGRADWVKLAGFDRWLGGVHLVAPLGGEVAWRWDNQHKNLVAARRTITS